MDATTSARTSAHRVRQGWPYAVSGLLAAAAGMSAGHLVAAFTGPAASPVLAVGSTVIDATPTPVKEWAVQTLGNADKPVLLGSVALVTALAAAGIGLVSRRRPTLASALVIALAGLAGAAAVLRPAAVSQDVIPALVTALVGALVLTGLRRLVAAGETATAPTGRETAVGPGPAGERDLEPGPDRPAGHESPLDHTAYATGEPGRPARRQFLVGAAGTTVGAAAIGGIAQTLTGGGTAPSSLTLPAPAVPAPALPAGIEGSVAGLTPFRTPLDAFYRVDTALVIPRVDVDGWELRLEGMVDEPFTLSYADLLEMDLVEKDITLNCVSNTVGGPYVSSTTFLGVRTRDLLARAGVQAGADQVLSESVDGMTISTPITALTDERDAMIAIGMDGKPLPRPRGFPARLVTPGLYGYVGATKWLSSLKVTTYARDRAYWTERDWAEKADVKTQARIDTPQGLRTQQPGTVVIAGVAWAQRRGIEKVEVRVDDGDWQEAELGPDGGIDYWRQWSLPWQATSGRHQVTVRATDGTGEVQTEATAEPFPSGASGHHSIVVLVA